MFNTRALDKDIVPTLGHYELRNSTLSIEVYDSISSMTSTEWSQGSPYNYYCPLTSNNLEHAPAGCVAIAGAQMLYFLHSTFGIPSTAPSKAYCKGNVNSYTWEQTDYSSHIWADMANNGYYAAPLIADVGRRLNMQYGDNGSGALTEDLINKVFVPYGISCLYTSYNVDLLRKSLLKGMPVILSAKSIKTRSSGTGKVGHAFIADRYKRTRMVTKNYYEWVYDSYPDGKPIPVVPDKVESTYSSPTISMIGFNWGWGSYYNVPTEWFGLTGDWISSQYSMSSYNWNINRNMIFGKWFFFHAFSP